MADNQHNQIRHLPHTYNGWFAFIKSNLDIPFAFFSGWSCIFAVLGFTWWLSRRIWICPDYAVGCHTEQPIPSINRNPNLTQGGVTLIYSVGLAALVYAAHTAAEPLLWPLLSLQSFKISEFEVLLAAARGSMPATAFAFWWAGFKSWTAFGVFLLISLITLSPLSAAPVVGQVYERVNITHTFSSQYQVGGGIPRLFAQTNPPDVALSEVLSSYVAISMDLATEPMPDLRESIVDRAVLANRGHGMTFKAIRAHTDIACRGTKVEQIETDKESVVKFATKMHQNDRFGRPKNSTNEVEIRTFPALSVAAFAYEYLDAFTTKSTLYFLSLNGTIEGEEVTQLTGKAAEHTQWVSAVACDVSIRLEDYEWQVGGGSAGNSQTILSSLAGLRLRKANTTEDDGLYGYNEQALWFAMAPLLVGQSVSGTQPQFQSQWNQTRTGLPTGYTSSDKRNNVWTISELEAFIRVSVGTVALASARAFQEDHPDPVILVTRAFTPKLEPKRVFYLLYPPLFITACGVILIVWSHHLHKTLKLPIMRMANYSELLKSSQSNSLRGVAERESHRLHTPSRLSQQEVRYGMVPGPTSNSWVAGLARFARPFEHDGHEFRSVPNWLCTWVAKARQKLCSQTLMATNRGVRYKNGYLP